MATLLYNLVNEYTTELLAPGSKVNIRKLSIANVQGTNACSVDLFIEKIGTGKYYFFKGISIPINTTLEYKPTFNNAPGEYGLYIKLTAATGTPAVDVMIL